MSKVYDVPIPVYIDDREVFPTKLCFIRGWDWEAGCLEDSYVILANSKKQGYGFRNFTYNSGEPTKVVFVEGGFHYDRKRVKNAGVWVNMEDRISVDQDLIEELFEDD